MLCSHPRNLSWLLLLLLQKNSGEVIDKVTNEALPELEKNLSQIKGNQINDNQEVRQWAARARQ